MEWDQGDSWRLSWLKGVWMESGETGEKWRDVSAEMSISEEIRVEVVV